MTAPRRRSSAGAGIAVGVALMALAVVGGALSLVLSVKPFADVYSSAVEGTGPELPLDLPTGRHALYVRLAPSCAVFDPADAACRSTPISGVDIEVVGPTGVLVAVNPPWESDGILSTESGMYEAVAGFTVVTAGTHVVRVEDPLARTLLVAPSFEDSLSRAAPWGLGIGAAVLVFIAGGVVLVVGIVRGSRAAVPLPAYAFAGAGPLVPPPAGMGPAVPPGWYPDPAQPWQRRYWDGRAWTAEVR